jgi:hypothetical protein
MNNIVRTNLIYQFDLKVNLHESQSGQGEARLVLFYFYVHDFSNIPSFVYVFSKVYN